MRKNLRTVSREERGFTLTEIAIVLGIIGLILGAIWAAASAVYSNMKNSQAEQGITASAQAVRSMFAASNNTGLGANAQKPITVPGMLPVSWVGSGNPPQYGNPWAPYNAIKAGAASAFINGDGGSPSAFGIELDGLSGQGCAALANYFAKAAASNQGGQVTGLVGLVVATPVNVNSLNNTTPGIGGAAITGWANGQASTCDTNTGGGGTGTSGDNAVEIWFDMSQM